ncbi:MAG: STAS domain-containing protein [Fibrobacterota bacterium]|nr:STAS domain-containing protein [Chitinispirillaceae bacterium]
MKPEINAVHKENEMDESLTCKLETNGDLSGHRVRRLEEEFAEAITAMTFKKVQLDISSAHNIDSPGIALCVGLFKECKMKKMEFEIIVNADLHRIFSLVNLDKILPIKES